MKNSNTKELKEIKKLITPVLRQNDVIRAGIFGSYARGEPKKNSDIDILIKFKGEKSLFDLVRLEMNLEKKIGKKVELVEYCIIHPRLKDQILHEEVKVI